MRWLRTLVGAVFFSCALGLCVSGDSIMRIRDLNGRIVAEWTNTEQGRAAKVYSLTREGKRQLERELDSWTRLSSAVGLLLQRA